MLLKDLQTLATKLATGTLFHVEKAGKAYSVDYSALAKAIIEEYADSTVGGSKQSVQAAIGALNSSLANQHIIIRNGETFVFDSVVQNTHMPLPLFISCSDTDAAIIVIIRNSYFIISGTMNSNITISVSNFVATITNNIGWNIPVVVL